MKYNISKEFGILRHLATTLNPFVLRFAKVFMSLLPKGMRSNKSLVISTEKIKTRDDGNITIHCIKPRNAEGKMPTIFFFHGGGFCFKGAPYHYKYAKLYAERLSCQVIFIDYRLAYNTPFDTSLNDCIDCYKYILERKEEYSVDTDRIAFVGDSAGGYLSLTACIKAQKLGLTKPKCQVLIYPVVDSLCSTESMKKYIDTPCWNAKLNRKMWEIYSKGESLPSLLEYGDASHFCTTYVETAEFDCLKDEGALIFDKISKKYKGSVLVETTRTMHGFDGIFSSSTTQSCIESRINFLASNLK